MMRAWRPEQTTATEGVGVVALSCRFKQFHSDGCCCERLKSEQNLRDLLATSIFITVLL